MSTSSTPDGFGTTPGALRDDDAAAAETVSTASRAWPSAGTAPLTPAGSDIEGASEPAEGIARTRHEAHGADTDADPDADINAGTDASSSDPTATARNTLSGTIDRITGMVDSTMQRGDEWMQSAREEVRAHPMAAVAAAFVAGMVFDRMRRTSSSREA